MEIPELTARQIAAEISQKAAAKRGAGEGNRFIIGFVGPPGCGKSTLVAALENLLPPATTVTVPMDGFHLANCVLEAHGNRQIKGAPQTFDAGGYRALMQRLAAQPDELCYAPSFRRDLEEPIAGAIEIRREVEIILTEGNYLLNADPDWQAARAALDEAWFLDLDPEIRRERLAKRHMYYGKSAAAAQEWAEGSDERNAEIIDRFRAAADRIIRVAPSSVNPSSASGVLTPEPAYSVSESTPIPHPATFKE